MAKDLRQLTPEEKAKRDELRNKTVGAPSVVVAKRIEWGGCEYEIRAPSMRLQQKLAKLSELKDGTRDEIKMLFQTLIASVYIPGTEILVFETADEQDMGERGAKDFIGTFAKAFMDLAAEVSLESAEKNS